MKKKLFLCLISVVLPMMFGCSGDATSSRIEKARLLGIEEARKVIEAHHRSVFATERALLHSRAILTLLNDEDIRLGDAYLEAFSGELEASDSVMLRTIILE